VSENGHRCCVVCDGPIEGRTRALTCSDECRRARKRELGREWADRRKNGHDESEALELRRAEQLERALADVRLAVAADLFHDRPGALGSVHHRLTSVLAAFDAMGERGVGANWAYHQALVELAAISVDAASRLPPPTVKLQGEREPDVRVAA
jgi:hypothetical protein